MHSRSARRLWIPLCFAGAWFGCSSSRAPAMGPAARPLTCGVDETREYACEDLLPVASVMPAPEPYQACPSSIRAPVSNLERPPSVGLFDASYTEYTRLRAPPGHACCFSWCSPLTLADAPAPAAPAAGGACRTATALHEEYCVGEPEGGTSRSVGPPFDRCPAAIVPPRKAAFAVPESALFDPQASSGRRATGQNDCCYSWCSPAPPGSEMQYRR